MTGHGVCVLSVINHLTTVIVPMRVSRVIVPQNKVRIMVRVFTCLFSFGLCVLFGCLFVSVRPPGKVLRTLPFGFRRLAVMSRAGRLRALPVPIRVGSCQKC